MWRRMVGNDGMCGMFTISGRVWVEGVLGLVERVLRLLLSM